MEKEDLRRKHAEALSKVDALIAAKKCELAEAGRVSANASEPNARTSENTLLQAALAHAAAGRPVFPCKNRPKDDKQHKRPLTRNGFYDATIDPEIIQEWWRKWPEALIGMPTGESSGIDVLDLDRKEDRDGIAAFPDWRSMSSVTASTCGGGVHLYFKASGVRCSSQKVAPGVDTRGAGGYVIVPPSPGYEWLNCSDLTDLPDWPADPCLQIVRGWEHAGNVTTWPMGLEELAEEDAGKGVSTGPNDYFAPDIDRAGVALQAIPPDCSRDEWIRIAMALNAGFGPEGEDLFVTWSSRGGDKFPGVRECAKQYRSCDKYATVTLGTLYHIASKYDGSWWKHGLDAEQQADSNKSKPGRKPDLVRVADIAPKNIEWLWPRRIARGKLTIIAGHPGQSKSTLTIDLAARITRGSKWPCGEGAAPTGNVIMITSEDDVGDTIHPRLAAAGADVTRVFVLRGMKSDSGRRGFDLTRDVEELESAVCETGDVVMVVIDPVTAYMGKPGKIDSHRVTDVRSMLEPLQDMAARLGVAVIGINHLTKGGSDEALMRFLGSVGMVATSRAAYLVAKDKGDAKRRLFLPAKNNIGDDETGYAFRVCEKPTGYDQPAYAVALDWESETVSITADEALAAEKNDTDGRRSDKLEEAKRIISAMLADGPQKSADLQKACDEAGISFKSYKNARDRLGVHARKIDDSWWTGNSKPHLDQFVHEHKHETLEYDEASQAKSAKIRKNGRWVQLDLIDDTPF